MVMTQIAAHRGASKAFRENTIDAFRGAGAMGAHMVELDVRRTLDRQLVIHHDPLIAGLGPIIGRRADQLPDYVPLLADALDACAGMDVNVEIKSDRSEPDYDVQQWVADAVVELLAGRSDRNRMLISSFDLDTIDRVHAQAGDLRTGFLYVMSRRSAAAQCERVAERGHLALHPHHQRCTKRLIEAAHASGLTVNTWTVDDPARMLRLHALGVDTIITNVPDVALATLNSTT
jgi:glycerophosphoryl diester phosphodiesterase